MALNYTEVLNLTITDLSRMEKEFYDYYEIILQSGHLRLRQSIMTKLKAIKKCQKFKEQKDKTDQEEEQRKNELKKKMNKES